MTSFIVTGGNYTNASGGITWDNANAVQFAGLSIFGGVEINITFGAVGINSIDDLQLHNVRTMFGASSSIIEIDKANPNGMNLVAFANNYDLIKYVMLLKSTRNTAVTGLLQATFYGMISDFSFGSQNVGENTTNMNLLPINRGKDNTGLQLYNLEVSWT